MEFPNITNKMSRVQGKITRHGKNQENRKKSRKLEKDKQLIVDQDKSDVLSDSDFKAIIIKCLHDYVLSGSVMSSFLWPREL